MSLFFQFNRDFSIVRRIFMVKQQIIEWIQAYERIIIHRHVRPDPDAYGSQAGLQRMIQLSFPKKEVYIVGEEDPDLHYLARMDEISDDKYNDALVIVCDTANTGRICDQRYKLGKKIVKIDHHPNVDPYGDLLWVDTDASSTSEMIYELFLAGKDNRSEEHTSELQSRGHLVCRLLLEKKKKHKK